MRLFGLRTDGGASSNASLLHLQADLLQCSVEIAVVEEISALGSAAMEFTAFGEDWPPDTRRTHFEPLMATDVADTVHTTWKQAIRRACSYTLERSRLGTKPVTMILKQCYCSVRATRHIAGSHEPLLIDIHSDTDGHANNIGQPAGVNHRQTSREQNDPCHVVCAAKKPSLDSSRQQIDTHGRSRRDVD